MVEHEKLVESLNYTAAILEANKDKFAAPDHITVKAQKVREAAATITALQARVGELEAKLANSIQWAGGKSPITCGSGSAFAKRTTLQGPSDAG